MATFTKADAIEKLSGKSVLFLGDSIVRNIYQDLVTLVNTGRLTSPEVLRSKGEQIKDYITDRLMNDTGKMEAGRGYKEERKMVLESHGIKARYYFLSRCWSQELKAFLERVKAEDGKAPDLVIVLSCIWDINRWGPGGIDKYKDNCKMLMEFLTSSSSESKDTQVVWLTSPPISVDVWGGLIVTGMEDQKGSIRFNILEGNTMVANTVADMGGDVIDLHYYMLHLVHLRRPDGLHWTQDAVRYQTNHILTHYCLSHDLSLPSSNDINANNNALLGMTQEIATAGDSDGAGEDDSPAKKRKLDD